MDILLAIGIGSATLMIAGVTIALKMTDQNQEERELREHKKWMADHEAWELNRNTDWKG